MVGQVHDPDLLDALEAMEPRSFGGVVWRVTWATRDPLAGGTGGGRWHPPNDFEALYASTEEQDQVRAGPARARDEQPIDVQKPRRGADLARPCMAAFSERLGVYAKSAE